jgi:hypothetical protein
VTFLGWLVGEGHHLRAPLMSLLSPFFLSVACHVQLSR